MKEVLNEWRKFLTEINDESDQFSTTLDAVGLPAENNPTSNILKNSNQMREYVFCAIGMMISNLQEKPERIFYQETDKALNDLLLAKSKENYVPKHKMARYYIDELAPLYKAEKPRTYEFYVRRGMNINIPNMVEHFKQKAKEPKRDPYLSYRRTAEE